MATMGAGGRRAGVVTLTYVQRVRAISAVRTRIELQSTRGSWMVRDDGRIVLRFVRKVDAKEFARLTGLTAEPMTPEAAAADWSWTLPCPRCSFQHQNENGRAACSRRG